MICDTHKWEKVATREDGDVWYCPNCGCTRDACEPPKKATT